MSQSESVVPDWVLASEWRTINLTGAYEQLSQSAPEREVTVTASGICALVLLLVHVLRLFDQGEKPAVTCSRNSGFARKVMESCPILWEKYVLWPASFHMHSWSHKNLAVWLHQCRARVQLF